jgi:type I restriction enzyme R subunit
MVKTYQDAVSAHPDLSNRDVEDAVKMIYDVIKDVADPATVSVQGRQGFIDETKKKITKMLLKSGLYKKLNLKSWIDVLLGGMYTNIHNY